MCLWPCAYVASKVASGDIDLHDSSLSSRLGLSPTTRGMMHNRRLLYIYPMFSRVTGKETGVTGPRRRATGLETPGRSASLSGRHR